MKYTIKDLSEGKCAVINDGTLDQLRKVLKLAFPEDTFLPNKNHKYYRVEQGLSGGWWEADHRGGCERLPTQSVKDFLIETEHKGKAVHCETQEQWDFASEKLGRNSVVKYKEFGDCIDLNNPGHSNTVDYFTKYDYKVLSFQEWLEDNGYVFEDKPEYIEGVWYESDCGKYYSKFLNTNDGYYYPHVFPSKEYIAITSKTHFTQGNYFNINTFTKVKLAPMEEVNKYLPKKHSYKDYKEGDYVVITEFEGKTDWEHWFMPGEVLKLGGKHWAGNIKNSFDACSKDNTEGNGMYGSFEENYRIRKATQEEIDNSQWGTKLENYKIGVDFIRPHIKSPICSINDLDNISDIAIAAVEPKTKLETIKVKRRSIIK